MLDRVFWLQTELSDQKVLVEFRIVSKPFSKVPDRRRCHIRNVVFLLKVKLSELELIEWRDIFLADGRFQVQES